MTLRALQIKYDIPQTKPVIDVKTRWNSTHNMLAWALKNEQPLTDLMWDSHLKFKYCQAIEILLDYLDVFAKVTSCVALQNLVSLSFALLSMEQLVEKIENMIHDTETPESLVTALKAAQKKNLKYRTKYHSKLFIVSTTIDALYEIYKHYTLKTVEKPLKRSKINKLDLFGEMLWSRNECIQTQTSEIDFYLAMKPQTNGVLEFWKLSSYKFPTLARIARDIFSIQGTSAASEREFNGALDITGLRQYSMSEDTFKKLKENQNSLCMDRETDVQ